MKSASELFIQEREREMFEGFENMKQGKQFPELKKHIDTNEEIEMMREHEEKEPFANEIFEREQGL